MTNLPAGPSLDAAVVQAVMRGFCTDPEAHTDTGESRYWLRDGVVLKGAAWKWDVPGAPLHGKWSRQWEKWSPSTSITDTWEVVEHMMATGHRFSLGTYGHNNEEWCATFAFCSDTADTAPHAICLAALKALS